MKLGFIGAGNMGGSILRGILKNGTIPASDILVSRLHADQDSAFTKKGVRVMPASENRTLAASCNCIFLCVKPQYADDILSDISDVFDGKLVISIMAGWPYERLEKVLPENTRFICAMPNLPVSVGEGITLISGKYRGTEEDLAVAKQIFACTGAVSVVDESVYQAANTLTGCCPAFAFMFIEALADAAVKYGVPRKMAYEYAAQMLIGAGKMALSGRHPGELKDAVCSPGGSTIEGVIALENGAFRATVVDAYTASIEKARLMAVKS